MILRLAAAVLSLLACHTACAQIVYTLNQPALFDSSPYGFSGTITTDGSTGSFASVDFITSWSIVVRTPATVDGVATELLDPTNSSISLNIANTTGLVVTEESLSLPLGLPPLATLSWSTPMNATVLQFNNRAGTEGAVSVQDASEPNPGLGIVARGSPIASGGVRVPEPSAVAIIATSLIALSAIRGRLKIRPQSIATTQI